MLRYVRNPAFGFLLILSLISALLAACATTPSGSDVVSDIDKQAAFDTYHSFTVQSVPESHPLSPLRTMLLRGMNAAMKAKGYNEDDSDAADLLVRFGTRIEQGGRLTEEQIPFGKGMRTRYGLEPIMEGRVLVNIVDMHEKRVVWKGEIRKPLNEVDLSNVTQDQVNAAMAQLLASFPARGASP